MYILCMYMSRLPLVWMNFYFDKFLVSGKCYVLIFHELMSRHLFSYILRIFMFPDFFTWLKWILNLSRLISCYVKEINWSVEHIYQHTTYILIIYSFVSRTACERKKNKEKKSKIHQKLTFFILLQIKYFACTRYLVQSVNLNLFLPIHHSFILHFS